MKLYKQKKSQNLHAKGNRILISINVIGSAGPIRLVVNEDETVGNVIDSALKAYAREGRLPVLGTGSNKFLLYCPIAGMSPLDNIGMYGVRSFMLGKKPGDCYWQWESWRISCAKGNWKFQGVAQ